MRRSSKKKFYKRDKAWLLFEVGSARSGNAKSVTILESDGNSIKITSLFDMPKISNRSYYNDVYDHITNDDIEG